MIFFFKNSSSALNQAQSNMMSLEKNLKIIEEMDEPSSLGSERKISPVTVADAVKITGDLMKNFSQINTILSNQLGGGGSLSPQFGEVIEESGASTSNEAAERSAAVDESAAVATPQQTTTTTVGASTSLDVGEILIDNVIEPATGSSSTITSTLTATPGNVDSSSSTAANVGASSTNAAVAPKDIIQIHLMKKLNEISQLPNVVTPLQHINSLFSDLANNVAASGGGPGGNGNVSFTALNTSSSSLNKKLAHFQKQTAASLGASLSMMNSVASSGSSRFSSDGLAGLGAAGASGRMATSFSYDLRLDMSIYQTLENYLFVR